MAGNGELGVLGIFLAIAVVLYAVSWTMAGPPGTVPLTAADERHDSAGAAGTGSLRPLTGAETRGIETFEVAMSRISRSRPGSHT